MGRLIAATVILILFVFMIHSVKAMRIPLEIEYPRPMFVCTPVDFRGVPNLQKSYGLQPKLLVPLGVRNVALGKSVSSSDESPIIGSLSMITDGDKEALEESYVELGSSLQHVTIDLKEMHKIFAIVVWHYHRQRRIYSDIIVQIANDADFTKNVKILFNNDIDNSAGLGVGSDMHYIETNEGKLIDAKGNVACYVRLFSNGNTCNELNHYVEVAVYGQPVE